MIDTSDIREMTAEDFAKGRKNPYAEKIKREGFSVTVHYSPEDVANMKKHSMDQINKIENMKWLDLDPDEIRALKKYRDAIHPE